MKYRNTKTELNGVIFDSKKEAGRYADLLLLQRAGEIEGLQRQVDFPLIVNGTKIGSYRADATYMEKGKLVVEDTKSPVTRKLPVYRIKKKLIRALYGIEILET